MRISPIRNTSMLHPIKALRHKIPRDVSPWYSFPSRQSTTGLAVVEGRDCVHVFAVLRGHLSAPETQTKTYEPQWKAGRGNRIK